jgi:hypothetical protein
VTGKTKTVVFSRPFRVPGLDEVLPDGEYTVEHRGASALIHLHATSASPGLARTLTVPLADLKRAVAESRLSGEPLADFLLDELLADTLVRLVMASDDVTEEQMRSLYSGLRADDR